MGCGASTSNSAVEEPQPGAQEGQGGKLGRTASFLRLENELRALKQLNTVRVCVCMCALRT